MKRIIKLFICVLVLVGFYCFNFEKEETKRVISFSNLKPSYNEEQLYGILEIPKIRLKRIIYPYFDKRNNVEKEIELLSNVSPDTPFSNIILAGHNGTSSVSYFRNLPKLKVGDMILLTHQGTIYFYQIVTIYEAEKGSVTIKRNPYKEILTLITCKTKTNKNIIIISELQGKEVP